MSTEISTAGIVPLFSGEELLHDMRRLRAAHLARRCNRVVN
jgi:hypothetical protein